MGLEPTIVFFRYLPDLLSWLIALTEWRITDPLGDLSGGYPALPSTATETDAISSSTNPTTDAGHGPETQASTKSELVAATHYSSATLISESRTLS